MEPEKLKKKLRGVFVVVATPFDEKDELDEEGLRYNLKFLVERGMGKKLSLIVAGSTGEFYALSEEEHRRLIKIAIDEVNGKLTLIAGTGQAGTKKALAMSKYAEDVGADGVIAVLPYYHVPTEEGMYSHFKTIAENIKIGMLVYNNPDTAKTYINPWLMARIAEINNIVGIKENGHDLTTIYWMIKTVGKKIPVLCGLGELWFLVESMFGCPGFISALANYAPEISLQLYESVEKGDFYQARKIVDRLEPLLEFERRVAVSHGPSTTILPTGFVSSYMWIGVMKEAMNIVGLKGGKPRLPLSSLTKDEKRELESVLEKIGIAKLS
ncbi:MAG: dihydrodipicolinate synthase family protein [Candidatus Bathyarchaeia archaeon]